MKIPKPVYHSLQLEDGNIVTLAVIQSHGWISVSLQVSPQKPLGSESAALGPS